MIGSHFLHLFKELEFEDYAHLLTGVYADHESSQLGKGNNNVKNRTLGHFRI